MSKRVVLMLAKKACMGALGRGPDTVELVVTTDVFLEGG